MKKIILMVLLVGFGVTAQAKMYKCTDANGKLSFQDRPCAASSSSTTLKTAYNGKARTTEQVYSDKRKADKVKQDKRMAVIEANREKNDRLRRINKCTRYELAGLYIVAEACWKTTGKGLR